jgi:hypothetical protein
MGRVRGGVRAVTRRTPGARSEAIEELEDLTEALEIQEVSRPRPGGILGGGGIVGAAQSDGGMPPVRESDDKIRIEAAAELEDLNLLAAERMMRMGDGDESQGRLG